MPNNNYLRNDIITVPQAITGTFVDLGGSFNVLTWGKMGVFISVLVNNSTSIQIKPLVRDFGSTTWFDLPIKRGLSTKTMIAQGLYEFSYTSDFDACFDIDTAGVGEIKLQIRATGNTPIPGIVTQCFSQLTPGGE